MNAVENMEIIKDGKEAAKKEGSKEGRNTDPLVLSPTWCVVLVGPSHSPSLGVEAQLR